MNRRLGIVNARDKNAGTHVFDQVQAGPTLYSVILGWMHRVTLTRITKTVKDHQTVEVEMPVDTLACVVPVPPQELKMFPEGQRAWDWETLYTHSSFELFVDDVLVYQNTRYRVRIKNAYDRYGIIKYTLLNDYHGINDNDGK